MAAALAACSLQPDAGQPTASVALSKIERDDFRPVPVDVLFVVDDSGSMAAEQAAIGRDFAALVRDILDPPPAEDGAPARAVKDLHVGVISTDLGVGGYEVQTCEDDPLNGKNGILQHAGSGEPCDASYPSFLSYAVENDAPPDLEAIEKLAADFSCISHLGTAGCGFEQQLEASHRALVEQAAGANSGFLRSDAILALVFLTDEEDCSAEDLSIFDVSSTPYSCGFGCYFDQNRIFLPSRYSDMLVSLKPGPDWVALAVIGGVPAGDPACNGRGDRITDCLDQAVMQYTVRPDGELLEYVCQYPPGCQSPDPPYPGDCASEAFPARRIVEVALALGKNATVSSICAESYEPVLLDLAAMIREKQNLLGHNPPIEVTKTGCDCTIECTLTETLAEGNTTCDPGKFLRVDGSGKTRCDIPQVGARLADCAQGCLDPAASFQAPEGGLGWYYVPNAAEGPAVEFLGLVPSEGASLSIQCR